MIHRPPNSRMDLLSTTKINMSSISKFGRSPRKLREKIDPKYLKDAHTEANYVGDCTAINIFLSTKCPQVQ